MLLNYIKIAWKVLLRHPFYTFVTLFGISLTLTVLIVLSSFIDHLVGSNYPEYKRERTLYVQKIGLMDTVRHSNSRSSGSYQFMKQYVKTLKTPEKVGLTTLLDFANAYVNGRRLELQTKFTDADFWEVTDFQFLEGKAYNQANIANGDQVAVITDDLKKQYFGDDTGTAVGKTVEVDNVRYRVIGVVRGAPVTRPYTASDIYFPYNSPKSNYQYKGFQGKYIALILAKSPGDFTAIRDEYHQVISRIPLPAVDNGFAFNVIETETNTYLESWLNIFKKKTTNIFYSVVALFMLLFMGLPAINLVNINVSRIMERASEIGIRKAFGAPAKTLVWQFIIENVFITFIGGLIALVLSAVVIYLINASGWFAYADLTINLRVFAMGMAVSLIFGLLSGVAPALRMSRLSITDALKAA